MDKVCDAKIDCDDRSDEFFCKTCLFDKKEYASHFPPFKPNEKAIVNVTMDIISIGDIDEVRMTFGSKFYVTLKWFDFRLKYKGIFGYHKNLASWSAKEIWLPSLSLASTVGNPSILSSDQFVVHIDMEGLPKLPNRR